MGIQKYFRTRKRRDAQEKQYVHRNDGKPPSILRKYIEITAWLASAYDFYARVLKARTSEFSNLSQQVHNKNRTNEPTMQ